MIRIVFIGAVDFRAHCLQEVLRQEANVVGVLTPAVDVAARASDGVDLGLIAERWGVPCHRFRRVGKKMESRIAHFFSSPDSSNTSALLS